MQFYTTSVFAYAGKESTEDVFTTPAQWFAGTGRYKITAASTSVPATARLAFDVVDPTARAAVRRRFAAGRGRRRRYHRHTCGQFANGAAWADVDGDGDPDLLVTRLGDPVQLFVNDGNGRFRRRGARRVAVGSATQMGRPSPTTTTTAIPTCCSCATAATCCSPTTERPLHRRVGAGRASATTIAGE